VIEEREVVIVGGGPAGSSVANVLASLGHDVLLLDKSRFPRPKPCSEYMSPGILPLLSNLGIDADLSGMHMLKGMRIHTPAGSQITIEYVDEHNGRYYAPTMERHVFDKMLLDHAAHKGVEVRYQAKVMSVVSQDNYSILRVQLPDRAQMDIRTKLVIGADGLRSVVARNLSRRYPLIWPKRMGLVTHINLPGIDADYGDMYVHPWGYCGVAATGKSSASVGIVLDLRRMALTRGREAIFEDSLKLFPKAHKQICGAASFDRIMGISPIGHGVKEVHGRNWALVGDAAGFFDPFTGEGIYKAVRGGILLGEVVSPYLKVGRIKEGLERYATERARVFRRKSLLVSLIQIFISYPYMLEYVANKLQDREALRLSLSRGIGDLQDPLYNLNLRFLFGLLRP